MTRKYFQNILRNSEPLNLIHNDICDFKFIQTRADKKYFITFIDDSTRYCHVYLLRSKTKLWMRSKFIRMKLKINLAKR